jgi:hypothetical protein
MAGKSKSTEQMLADTATAAQTSDETAADAPTARPAALAGRTLDEIAQLLFGAIVGAARQASGTGERLEVDLRGLESKLPRRWIGPFAALRSLLEDKSACTEADLRGRLPVSVMNTVQAAVRDGIGLAGSAGAMLEFVRTLPDTNRAGGIGGHRGGRRIRVRHNGRIGSGWSTRKPRPVRVGEITLMPGSELELVVADREFLQWKSSQSVDLEVLEGEQTRVATKV